jgi:hypothetical protein
MLFYERSKREHAPPLEALMTPLPLSDDEDEPSQLSDDEDVQFSPPPLPTPPSSSEEDELDTPPELATDVSSRDSSPLTPPPPRKRNARRKGKPGR